MGERNLVSIDSVVNDCFLSKTAKFCQKWLRYTALARPVLFASDRAAVSGWCCSVFAAEVTYEVGVRCDPDLLQDLLDAEKRRAQHLLRLAQPQVFEVLRRTRSCLLFK